MGPGVDRREGVLVLASDAGCVQAVDRLGVDAHGANPRESEGVIRPGEAESDADVRGGVALGVGDVDDTRGGVGKRTHEVAVLTVRADQEISGDFDIVAGAGVAGVVLQFAVLARIGRREGQCVAPGEGLVGWNRSRRVGVRERAELVERLPPPSDLRLVHDSVVEGVDRLVDLRNAGRTGQILRHSLRRRGRLGRVECRDHEVNRGLQGDRSGRLHLAGGRGAARDAKHGPDQAGREHQPKQAQGVLSVHHRHVVGVVTGLTGVTERTHAFSSLLVRFGRIFPIETPWWDLMAFIASCESGIVYLKDNPYSV